MFVIVGTRWKDPVWMWNMNCLLVAFIMATATLLAI
jgi:hypothetical protein